MDLKPGMNKAEEVRLFFDKLSVARNATINSNPIVKYEQDLRSNTVLNLLAASPKERILDIGCGNARDIVKIASSGAEVVGVDISKSMVEAAKKETERIGQHGISLTVGDATHLDFADSSFDKVLCSEVIEHIPNTDLALSEMWRVLKPGGTLVISTPNSKSWYGLERYLIWEGLLKRRWPHPCDNWRSVSEVETLLDNANFSILSRTSVCFVPGFIVTYFILPNILKRLLVATTKLYTPHVRKFFGSRGYTICISACRPA